MNIYIIPKVIETYKNQIEYSVEQKLVDFLKYVFANSKIEILVDKKIKIRKGLIVLSGGNTIKKLSKKKKDIIRDKLDNYYFKKFLQNKNQLKLLAICHGAQFIGLKFNANLIYLNNSNHIKSHFIHFNNKKIKVNSFHKIIIKSVPNNFKKLSLAYDQTVEAFKHKKIKILCIMWHPERNTKFKNFDKKIIKKYL